MCAVSKGSMVSPRRWQFTLLQDFTSAGAVVAVNALTGDYKIIGTFDWPMNAIFGCAALFDPVVDYDRSSGMLYLDFTDDFGLMVRSTEMVVKGEREAEAKLRELLGGQRGRGGSSKTCHACVESSAKRLD